MSDSPTAPWPIHLAPFKPGRFVAPSPTGPSATISPSWCRRDQSPQETIAAEATAATSDRLALGQRVRVDQRVKPQYLRGETGSVHGLYGDSVVVLLDRVVGRFTSRHLRCAPEVIEGT